MLEKSGYSAYAVGGAVRDSLLDKEPSDWDVTTSALPEETQRVFADFRTIPTGIKHGTVTVLFDDNGTFKPIEITTFRVDGEYRDSRHPENVSFSRNLRDDLSRRDFTVNAMAFNEKEGIVDAFGGKIDLENRTIRAVGKPQKRFTEDALRILRAFRFAAQLDFEIEQKTLEATSVCAHLIKNIARERVGVEFKKLLAAQGVSYSLQKMIENGVWQKTFETPAPYLEAINKLPQLKNGNFATRLCALIFQYSDEEKEAFLNSLRLSNDEKRLCLRLCKIKDFQIEDNSEKYPSGARRFLHLYNNIYDEALEMLIFFNDDRDLSEFISAISQERSKSTPLTLSDLEIRGNDILPFCNGNYANVGKILNLLLERVIENPELNKKETLLEITKKELL
jgi:tRNA nucleotidyltransferase (CCA-adding enzyme)